MVLQNLFKEYPPRSPSDFVGREAELNLFHRTLNRLFREPGCFIINISGQAGVGKTELLRQYRKRLDTAEVVWALTAETDPDVPAIMGKIAEQFKQQGHVLRKFSDRYHTYLQCLQRLEADPEKPQGLTKAVGQAATKWLVTGARQIPVLGVAVGMFDENTLAAQGGEWLAFVAKKLTNKDDVRLVKSPLEELTPLFLQGLHSLSNKHPIVLCFDAYERTNAYLDKWLREILVGEQYGKPPDKLLLIIAGQQELNRTDWDVFRPEVIRQPLQPFTEQESRDFLKHKGITEASLVTEILELSHRLPLLLNTLAVQAPTSTTAVVDRAEDVVDRYLRWIEDPQKRKLVLDTALARSVNQDVIATLTTPDQADALFDWLVKQPFVNKKTKTWCYESLMREMMVRHKRQRTVLEWVTLHEKLAQLYQQLCDIQGLDAKTSQYNPTWQTYQLEKLYHQLCQAPQKFLQSALLEFLAAFKRQPLAAHLWADTIRQAGEETGFDELIQWGEQMVRGLIAYDQDTPTDAIALFTALLKQKNLEPEWQAKVLHWRGNLYGRSKQYVDALADLNEAVRLMPQTAGYYRDRGLVYLFDGQYSQALSDLTQAIALNPEDTKANAYRGIVYAAQADCPRAIEDFTHALKVQPDFQSVLVSRAAAYRDVEDYQAALADLNRALELVPEDLSAIAERGKIYQAMERPEDALLDLNQVLTQNPDNVSLLLGRGIVFQQLEQYGKALADFNRVLELEPDNPDALANRGETFRRLERYEEAIADLSRVIEQHPEDAWAIGIRGTAYRQFGYPNKALEDFERAIELAPENDWWYYSKALCHDIHRQSNEAHSNFVQAKQLALEKHKENPNNWSNQLNLGLYFLALQEYQKAEQVYRLALEVASLTAIKISIRDIDDLFKLVISSPDGKTIQELLRHKIRTNC